MHKLKKFVGTNIFCAQSKLIPHNKKIGITLMYCDKLHALVVTPITVDRFACHRNCTNVSTYLFVPFIQTFHNYCSHIEDVHLLFVAPFIDVFPISGEGVLNLDIFRLKCL